MVRFDKSIVTVVSVYVNYHVMWSESKSSLLQWLLTMGNLWAFEQKCCPKAQSSCRYWQMIIIQVSFLPWIVMVPSSTLVIEMWRFVREPVYLISLYCWQLKKLGILINSRSWPKLKFKSGPDPNLSKNRNQDPGSSARYPSPVSEHWRKP